VTIRNYGKLIPLVLLIGAATVSGIAHAGETVTFNAFSVWQASAQTFQTATTTGTVFGVLRGPLYVETDEGPTRTGSIACPVTIQVDLQDARQQGRGRCTITTADDALAFASFECSGYHLVGCTGEFKIEGGTSRLKGVTGGGPVTFRGDRWALASASDSEVSQAATGIAFWRDFNLTMP
jgi:hypothetical protein